MITKVELKKVACYNDSAVLETDKRINLVYGLNGAGKTTFSDFLYDQTDPKFLNCTITGLNDEEILVYNQTFIQDYFYEQDKLKGIFTLSKENKGAAEKIKNAQSDIQKLESKERDEQDRLDNLRRDLESVKQNTINKLWEIKTNYASGDGVLAFCLEKLNKSKEKLFHHILDFSKPENKPVKDIDTLTKEVEQLQGENAQKYDVLPRINVLGHEIESHPIFQTEIVGNENSTVSELINKLGNSDWVKIGMQYLPEHIDEQLYSCPFCQEKTITKAFVYEISNFFDVTYEKNIEQLQDLFSSYQEFIDKIQPQNYYEGNPFIGDKNTDFMILYSQVFKIIENNIEQIKGKISTPGQKIDLKDSSKVIGDFNEYINRINLKIIEHNQKIDNKQQVLDEVKQSFWGIMRWQYDQTISSFQGNKKKIEQNISKTEQILKQIIVTKKEKEALIRGEQKKTVTIQSAIDYINRALIDLGIDNFRIEKDTESDNFYRIVRGNQTEKTFQTLSEGEKMIISFLYYFVLCQGRQSAGEIPKKKVLVIDDPISSLSHIFIFNIGELIKRSFFNSQEYEQIFVLTHSLYFFYELADTNHKRREDNQKLFRMTKNCDGTEIRKMKYDEIQNDYHSYWYIVREEKQHKALIANCMRSIIDYFFNFVEKKNFNNLFQSPELQANKFQAFRRYVDRESHASGQNIFDLHEFDYDVFKEAFRLVFYQNGYKDHYDKMMQI